MQTTLNIILVLCFLWCYNDKTATENPFGYDLDMSSSGFFTALKTSCAPQLCCSWEKRKHESVCKVTALKRVTDGTRAMPAWSLTSQLTPLAGSRPVLVLKTSNLWSQQFQTLTFLCQTVLQGLKSDNQMGGGISWAAVLTLSEGPLATGSPSQVTLRELTGSSHSVPWWHHLPGLAFI